MTKPNTVQRYSLQGENGSLMAMPHDAAQYVRYSDYQLLQARVETLEKALARVKYECNLCAGLSGIDTGEQRAWKSLGAIASAALANAGTKAEGRG